MGNTALTPQEAPVRRTHTKPIENNALGGASTRVGLQKCILSAQGHLFRCGTCFWSQKCISDSKMQKVASGIVGKALVFLDICGPGRPSAENCPKVHFVLQKPPFGAPGHQNVGFLRFCWASRNGTE